MLKQFSPKYNESRLTSRLVLSLLNSPLEQGFGKQQNNQQRGLSLVELTVGAVIALFVIGLVFSGAIANRKLFLEDQTRNNVNQNLRSGLDIIGNDVQQIGEGLGTVTNFPAVQVTDNGPGTSSEMVIRRRSLNPLLLCADLTSGTNAPVVVGIPGSTLPGCNPTPDTNGNVWPDQDLETWRNYRLENGGQVRVFLFDGRNNGEAFDYNLEERSPNVATGSFQIQRAANVWANSYTAGRAAAYLIEERRYRLCPAAQIRQPNCTAQVGQDNILHVIVNGDLNNPVQLINGIDQFNVQINHRDPEATPLPPPTNTVDFCWQGAVRVTPVPTPPVACNTATQTWNQITSISVTMRGLNDVPSDLIRLDADATRAENKRLLSKEFFPRNVLSF
jgi:hypothetical protein